MTLSEQDKAAIAAAVAAHIKAHPGPLPQRSVRLIVAALNGTTRKDKA